MAFKSIVGRLREIFPLRKERVACDDCRPLNDVMMRIETEDWQSGQRIMRKRENEEASRNSM